MLSSSSIQINCGMSNPIFPRWFPRLAVKLTLSIANLLLTIKRNNLACYRRSGEMYRIKMKTMVFQERKKGVVFYNFASSDRMMRVIQISRRAKKKRGSGRTEPNSVRCLCPKLQAIYEQSVPIIVVQFLFGYDFVPVVEYFDTLTWGEGDYLLLVFYEGMLRLDAVRRETQNCWRNLKAISPF